jgi:hypothetical protein
MSRQAKLALVPVVLVLIFAGVIIIGPGRPSESPQSKQTPAPGAAAAGAATPASSAPAVDDIDPGIQQISEALAEESQATLIPESIPMRVRIADDVTLLREEDAAESLSGH